MNEELERDTIEDVRERMRQTVRQGDFDSFAVESAYQDGIRDTLRAVEQAVVSVLRDVEWQLEDLDDSTFNGKRKREKMEAVLEAFQDFRGDSAGN